MGKTNTATKQEAGLKNNDVNLAVLHIEKAYKRELKTQSASTNCCVSLFNRIRSIKIPQEYQDVIDWLAQVAIQLPNQEVISSALIVSLNFASQNTTGSQIPADALIAVINTIAAQFNLTLDTTPDYEVLQTYCDEKGIEIPAHIKALMGTVSPEPIPAPALTA